MSRLFHIHIICSGRGCLEKKSDVEFSILSEMADPPSVAGLALSVASLTFELFSGCVKGEHEAKTTRESRARSGSR